jgi:hypothetical protein
MRRFTAMLAPTLAGCAGGADRAPEDVGATQALPGPAGRREGGRP